MQGKLGNLDERRPMIFQQNKFELHERICFLDTLMILKRRVHNCFKIPIINNADSNKTLPKKTEILRL